MNVGDGSIAGGTRINYGASAWADIFLFRMYLWPTNDGVYWAGAIRAFSTTLRGPSSWTNTIGYMNGRESSASLDKLSCDDNDLYTPTGWVIGAVASTATTAAPADFTTVTLTGFSTTTALG